VGAQTRPPSYVRGHRRGVGPSHALYRPLTRSMAVVVLSVVRGAVEVPGGPW